MEPTTIAPNVSFASWLKHRRNSLDLTRKGLADCVGCSPKTIEKIESGDRRPSRQIVQLLLECLQVPQEDHEALLSRARVVSSQDEGSDGDIVADFTTYGGLPPKSPDRPNNLPAPLTSFVGRAEALEAVQALLQKAEIRLVTLTGPPGIGKTRLSLRIGTSLLRHFKDGVFFVPLAAVRDTKLVGSAIAREFGLRESAGRTLVDVLKVYLREKHLLLILDNFEQVVEASPIVTQLLAAAPNLKIIATSREALHLYGEHNYAVQPLDVPGIAPIKSDGLELSFDTAAVRNAGSYSAVRLFVERASAAEHGFTLSAENAGAVVAICRELDGLPLAIELAAARVAQVPVDDMLSRLHQKLDLLIAGPRDLPPRQRTLRGAIEWSHDLLDGREKVLFRRLSIFAGGATIEAISSVCDPDEQYNIELLPYLQSLSDKSLLEVDRSASGKERFRMLETIHEYALEMLVESGEQEIHQERHAAFFLELARRTEPMLAGPEQGQWLDRLSEEHDNTRAAFSWLLKHDMDACLRLCTALAMFWYRRGHLSEGRLRFMSALENASSVTDDLRGAALNGAGTLTYAQGDYEEAKALYTASLAAHRLAGDKKAIAKALNNLGLIASNQADYEAAQRWYDDSLGLWQELGDKAGIALSLNNRMAVALVQGKYDEARAAAEESVRLRREMGDKAGIASSLGNLAIVLFALGDDQSATRLQEESLVLQRELGIKHGIANCLLNLGELARYRNDNDKAERLCDECLQICLELGDKPGIGNAWTNLGHVAHERGDLDKAESYFRQSVELFRESGDRRSMVQGLVGLAGIAGSRGQLEEAARIIGLADDILEEIGARLYPYERRDYERTVAAVRPELGAEGWDIAWQYGKDRSSGDISELTSGR